ncbi:MULTISPECIES: class I SAM-dependent methyltransferase [Catenuloplanes]|uniref:SAM-dependent methyltransferase n=1 Tax=Catenuloplanes niger TaxID=587534 RepID=A0AAE4CX21_9ACTN|nr:class I SAM-dependent methyltransferase [Catenuloplanes niger]MDR7327027.1 SAM-dependent methyltransferase [Catenuloplanes niger]
MSSETAERRYADFYRYQASSPTLRQIYVDVYGDDYPDELQPFGFVTRTDLARIAALTGPLDGGLLVDVGCGRGGPGVSVALASGARLLGLDVVPAAVEGAPALAASLGLATAEFRQGSFTETGVPAGTATAVMSIDALWMVWNKPAALTEIHRILRPGGRFVFTTWEPSYLDHAKLLAKAGFQVSVREETPDWLDRQGAVYARVLASTEALERELGPGAEVIFAEARDTPAVLGGTPRVLLAADRP